MLRTSVRIANSLRGVGPRAGFLPPKRSVAGEARPEPGQASIAGPRSQATSGRSRAAIKNDPSAGSPTETLLRLLVPPVGSVRQTLPNRVQVAPLLSQLHVTH